MQVHEKSILLPLMPILLLAEQEPFLAGWMPIVSAFSMFPLLKKDGVAIAYAGCVLLWISIALDAQFSLAPQTKVNCLCTSRKINTCFNSSSRAHECLGPFTVTCRLCMSSQGPTAEGKELTIQW